jgi:O-antigen/teichoic acid export membrane protein
MILTRDRRNSLWLAIQYTLTILFSLITLKLNLLNYGEEVFGSWILVASLWGFGRALDFGLGTSLVKFVAEFNHKDNPRLNNLITTCFILMMVLGLVILVTIFGIGWLFYFGSQEIISKVNYQDVLRVFIILGISFYLNYLSITFKSIFEGLSDFVIPSKINIVNSVLILTSVIICFSFNLPLTTLAFFYLVNSLLNMIVYIVVFRLRHSSIHIRGKYFEFLLIRKVFSFSLAIQGAAIFGSLIDPLIKYLIGNFSSVGAVSIYEIARRFVTAITGLFNSTFSPILPKASVLANKNEYSRFIYEECAKLSKIGIAYSGIVFGIGAFIVPIVIKQMFNFDEAVLIFFILAVPESINNFGYAIYNFLIGIEKAYFLVIVQLINIIIIGLSVFLGLVILGNLLGLLGYGLTVIIVNILMIIFARRVAGFSIIKYFSITKVYKLLILQMFFIATVLFIFFGRVNIYIVFFSLGSLSILVFFNDLKNYSSLILQQIGFGKDV